MWFKRNKNTVSCNSVKLISNEQEECRYAFVDAVDHQADRILMGALIPVRYEKVETNDPESPYELRICAFKERYESWFLCSMSDLEWVLEKEKGYAEACERILGASVVIRAAKRELEKEQLKEKPFAPTAGLKRLGLSIPSV